ncbi:hypothetical protein [Edaphovirga cremea]|uniref:hypothetical protein n=1 Tax=Edaphovirga cremea TaxID=2267246 RepID=UPI000DEFF400|nr:hypothetical protein [Edaphovirga cremea]
MTTIAIPFSFFSLDRACELLEDKNINCSPQDIIALWKEGKVELCYNWEGKYDEIKGLVYPSYNQVMNIHNGLIDLSHESIEVRQGDNKISLFLLKYSEEYGEYVDFKPLEDLHITKEELLKVYDLFTNPNGVKIHGNVEWNAKYRERLYMQAIRVLFSHPNECKNENNVTQDAWAQAILDHQKDYGYLTKNTTKDSIIKQLRKALNITINEK